MAPLVAIDGLIHKGLPPQLKTSANFMIFNMAWTFLIGEYTGNYSQGEFLCSYWGRR